MRRRPITGGGRLALLATGLLLAVLLSGIAERSAGAGSAPLALACPEGQTTWLRGQAAPGSALIARFGAVAVGGGSAGPDGTWAIPLTVRERPGIYSVEVTDRQGGHTLAAFTCYVDVPVGASPTGTPTSRPEGSPSPRSRSSPSAASPAEPTTLPVTIAPAEQDAVKAATPIIPGGSPTPSPTRAPSEGATQTPAESQTPAPAGTPGPSPDPQSTIAILAVQPHDPAQPELFEYLLLENLQPTPQNLAGWSLTHKTTSEVYTLPALTVPAEGLVAIWSGDGVDDPETSTLYWPTSQGRWSAGDAAELRSPDGTLVSTLIVSPEPDSSSIVSPEPDSSSEGTSL